jgi:hypothetical protein
VKIKAKTYRVDFGGKTYFVNAMTKAGAQRDLLEHLNGQAVADLATGEEIYRAGVAGEKIIGADRYANAVDLNQMPLAGIPETEKEPTP